MAKETHVHHKHKPKQKTCAYASIGRAIGIPSIGRAVGIPSIGRAKKNKVRF